MLELICQKLWHKIFPMGQFNLTSGVEHSLKIHSYESSYIKTYNFR